MNNIAKDYLNSENLPQNKKKYLGFGMYLVPTY
jgi:hypothetical protein